MMRDVVTETLWNAGAFRRRRQGLTLIELVVAIGIAAFVVAALYGLFLAQSRQFLYQDIQMEMHQNIRFGTDVLTTNIRMAGFNTPGNALGVLGSNGTVSGAQFAMPVVVPQDGGSAGSDAITILYADPSTLVETRPDITENCNTTSLAFDMARLQNAARLAAYATGDLLLCYDYANITTPQAYMWRLNASADLGSGLLRFNNADTPTFSDFDTVCTGDLPPILRCGRGQLMTFYIDDVDDGVGPGSPQNPVLMMDTDFNWPDNDDVPLVDNIEDLQVQYCVADGVGDCNDTLWFDTFNVVEVDDVWAVRLNLIARSSQQDPRGLHQGLRPGLANRSGAAAGDSYYRQVLTTEVALRNIRMP